MSRTIAPVMRRGAGRPGMSAVVMTRSISRMCRWISSSSRRCWSSPSSAAYPPAASAAVVTASGATKLAPRLSTCSFTAGRTSNADTTAPSRRAVAIACSPATPAPSTNTLAGASVPAAVVSIGKRRGDAAAATSTAL